MLSGGLNQFPQGLKPEFCGELAALLEALPFQNDLWLSARLTACCFKRYAAVGAAETVPLQNRFKSSL